MKLLPAFLLSHSWGAVQLEFPQFPQFALPPFRRGVDRRGMQALPAEIQFPAFPVFPAESVVLDGSASRY